MDIEQAPGATTKTDIGPFGLAVDITPEGTHLDAAAEVEELGYSAIWLAGGQIDRLDRISELVGATRSATVAPGIIPTGIYSSDDVAALYSESEREHPGRLLVGLGGQQSSGSMAALGAYTDRLDAGEMPVGRRLLAALGPRKLALARDRFAGAVTLLTTPEFTAAARRTLGPDRLLVAGLMVVLDDDPARARAAARPTLEFLASVPGYAQNFRRMGFTEQEVATLDDRLLDSVVTWGGPEAIAERIAEHRRAGADHVEFGALSGPGQPGSLEVARTMAAHLFA